MAKFPEAHVRNFQNIFVCKKCASKIRAPNQKVTRGKILCRRCNSNAFRTKRKK